MERKVVIIGAGVSGLIACKYALSKGYYPTVYESRSTIGGVWIKTLETTKLQTPKSLYQFSDFPWPSSTLGTEYPDHNQVLDYIESYAKHFDLLKYIQFNTRVVSINYEGPSNEEISFWTLWGGNGDPFANKGRWVITTESTEVTRADFIILCMGRFSDMPNIPEFASSKGPEIFHGKVMHSMDYSAMDYEAARNSVKGKRIIVVGFQQSAIDIAMEYSTVNGVKHPCTVICRTPHWNVNESVTWEKLYWNRFSELMVHKPGEGPLLKLLASLLSPLRWAISKIVEAAILNMHPLKKFGMVPDHSFLQEMNSCSVATIPEGFYQHVEQGSIILKRYPTFSFQKEGVLLCDDSVGSSTQLIKSDLVIFATGFKGDQKLKNIFASPIFQDYMGFTNTIVPFYRECIHPRIPQLAVIGYSESASDLYTSELRCRWLFEFLDGKFILPSIEKMEEDVLEWEKYMKRYSGKYYRRSCIGAVHIWSNDQLCKDMGWNPKRKKGFLADLFHPYGPMDYA